MPRTLSALLVLLLLGTAAHADDRPIVIRWHGQSFFEVISRDGVRVVLDPHMIEEYPRVSVSADLIVMSHLHVDHSSVEAVENHRKAKKINAIKQTSDRRQDWNNVDEKLKDVRVQTVGTYHDAMSGLVRGKNGVIILDVDGVRIVHLGDLGHQLSRDQLRALGTVDVLMIPIGGSYTINGIDAQRVVEQIKPRRFIIPMHYGTAVYHDLLSLDESAFLEEQEMGKVQKLRTNELRIDPEAEVPAQPTIAILHFQKRGA